METSKIVACFYAEIIWKERVNCSVEPHESGKGDVLRVTSSEGEVQITILDREPFTHFKVTVADSGIWINPQEHMVAQTYNLWSNRIEKIQQEAHKLIIRD